MMNKMMNNMKILIFLCFCSIFFLSGCDCRNRTTTSHIAFTVEGGVNADSGLRQKEDFDRSFGLLNSLEETPCLPETPGYEKLVSIADRLDKWIQHRAQDDTWKPDATLLEMENVTRTVAATALETVQLLNLLQGKEVADQEGKPIVPSESLEEERKKVTELLNRLA
ncbi:MAG: hypothetical protein LBQ50_08550, partial [Planctomycetaceae bacterium]|nr:hypothetical protein [Planctomycetaceae bacterium]